MGKRIGWEYEKYLTLSFFSMKAKLLQSLYDFRLDVTEKYLGDEIILFNVQSPIDSLWTAAMEEPGQEQKCHRICTSFFLCNTRCTSSFRRNSQWNLDCSFTPCGTTLSLWSEVSCEPCFKIDAWRILEEGGHMLEAFKGWQQQT